MIPETKKCGCKVKSFNQMDLVGELKSTFTKNQKELFLSNVFGHFLSMPSICFQAQLIHHVLLHDVYSTTEEDDFWFNINGTLVRYSIEEFCLVTGLKCHGDVNTSHFVSKKGGLKDITFPIRSEKVTKKELRDAFVGK